MYYQHNWAPLHFSTCVAEYLNGQFPDKWTEHDGSQNWPLRSPNFTPVNFHICGYKKHGT